MMLLVCLTLLATTALALPAGDMGMGMGMMDMMTTEQPAPKTCCTPKTWQATLIDLKSPTGLQYVTLYAIDGDKKIEASLTVPMNGGAPVGQKYTDYNSMTTYSVSSDGKCMTSKAAHDYPDNCMGMNGNVSMANSPFRNVNYVGSATLGTSIKYDGWNFMIGAMDITIALSSDKCIPLFEGVKQDDQNAKIDSVFLFNDVSTTITDTYLLAVPAACISSSAAVVG